MTTPVPAPRFADPAPAPGLERAATAHDELGPLLLPLGDVAEHAVALPGADDGAHDDSVARRVTVGNP